MDINWYQDKNIGIFFDKTPCVTMRYATPSMTHFEKEAINKYPFINRSDLKVTLFDYKKDKKYCFTVQKDYSTRFLATYWFQN